MNPYLKGGNYNPLNDQLSSNKMISTYYKLPHARRTDYPYFPILQIGLIILLIFFPFFAQDLLWSTEYINDTIHICTFSYTMCNSYTFYLVM